MDVISSDLELVYVGSTPLMRKRTVPAAGLQEVGGLNRVRSLFGESLWNSTDSANVIASVRPAWARL